MKRVGGVAAVVAAGAMALAGCSGSGADEAEAGTSASAMSSATPLGEVGSIDELKDAAVAAGMECGTWVQTNAMTLAAESGECRNPKGDYVLSTYISEAIRDDAVRNYKDFTLDSREVFEEQGTGDSVLPEEETLLVGPNWMIAPQAADSLQEELGGRLVTF